MTTAAAPTTARAITIAPAQAVTYHDRGEAYEAEGEYERAIGDLSKAIDLNPAFADAYGIRGKAYEAKGDLVHAMADFRKVRDLMPTDRNAMSSIATSGHEKEKFAPVKTDCGHGR